MPRKTRVPIPAESIDRNNTSPLYWSKILDSYGLSLARGSHGSKYVSDDGQLIDNPSVKQLGTSGGIEHAMLGEDDLDTPSNGKPHKIKPLANQSATRNPNDLN